MATGVPLIIITECIAAMAESQHLTDEQVGPVELGPRWWHSTTASFEGREEARDAHLESTVLNHPPIVQVAEFKEAFALFDKDSACGRIS